MNKVSTVTEAIGKFLQACKIEHNADLVERWTPAMETQVNIHKADGEQIEGTNKFTNGQFEWWPIRVPKDARTNPSFYDGEMKYPLEVVGDAIGSTGWDWKALVSRWVGFDFDDLTKSTGISTEQLAAVEKAACELPYVEVRKSTGGKGRHLYVLLDAIPTENHKVHAQLAKCVLRKMSDDCGFDFLQQNGHKIVDVCGGVLWIWARKMTVENEGLKLLKASTQLLTEDDLAAWRETFESKSGKSDDDDFFDQITGGKVSLDERHRAMIRDASSLGYASIWHDDLQCWHTHTRALFEIGKQRGIEFTTISRGTDKATPNCYCFPKADGWAVYRFNNAREHGSWRNTSNGCVTRDFSFRSHSPVDRFTFGELLAAYPNLNPPVIDGLIREGETCNLISYSKSGKSWLGYSMLLSVVTGGKWLGRFGTSQGTSLLLDNELHRSTLASRIPMVADRYGYPFDSYEDQLHIWPLRGNLKTLDKLESEFRDVEPGRYKLIVFDAMYRFAIDGISENDNAAMAQFYNQLDRIAYHTKAAIVLIHHTAKGEQGNKRVTDVGAGAGAQSRAADCHLILREHEDADTVVLDAAVRSFEPVKPMTLKWNFPVWLQCGADPEKLKTQPSRGDRRLEAKDRKGMDAIAKALETGPATFGLLVKTSGVGRDRLTRLAGLMVQAGKLSIKEVEVRGKPTTEYALAV